MAEPRNIEELAQKQIELFLAEESCQFLDAAIRLMAHTMPLSAVARRLRDEAELLEEYG
ncbi:hypothetical protein [Mesorhizobium sp. M2D.F.Ca.ET.223.01.1.1]|uniref:hypothetical protein n=1 Tax=Mesorhizobium sp. M2D.F.Ca.ET.223.01.1.1 TaxID=2563940 RepID=UPI00142EFE70|nr:hypothetical protein [Mesorhizobium sp. M2D.F.Ca.ET.223.01.1.1]